MPPIMANSKDGQDKYLDTSIKILSQEMLMCNMKALIFIIWKLRPMSIFKKRSNVKVKRFSTNKKILSLGIFMRNIKALALTVQKLLARLKF